MGEYFEKALQNFVKNFAAGGAVIAYHKRGLSPEEIKDKLDFPLSVEEIQKIIDIEENNTEK